MKLHSNMKQNQEDNTKAPAVTPSKKLVQIGDKESTLIKVGNRVLSKRGLHVPALIEFLKLPKWTKRARNYDPNLSGAPNGKLCKLKEVTKVMRGAAYEKYCDEVRSWMPTAVRKALAKGAFIIIKQDPDHHNRTTEIILCPSDPSEALRELAKEQITKRTNRAEMSKKQANEMLKHIGEPVA
jgi:hypothetical protein